MRPLCLGTFGIGARQQDAVVGIVRARSPDLLAVDDPVVALLLGAGAKPGDIGSPGGFGKQLAPDLFAGGERRQVFSFLLFAGEGHHGRPAHAVADDEHAAELAESALFLLPDHALDRRRAAAAIFLRPVQAGPAGIGLFLLPGFRDFEDVGALELGAAERGFAQILLILLGRIRRDPGPRLAAERGLLRGVVEVHSRVPTPRFVCASGRSARLPNKTGCRASARSRWRAGSTCGSRIPR